jgi:hypothetical protein
MRLDYGVHGDMSDVWNKGIVNKHRVILDSELRDYLARFTEPDEILTEVAALHGRCQILEWESPFGRRYRFFVQQLDAEGEPMAEITHPLIKKEFLENGN